MGFQGSGFGFSRFKVSFSWFPLVFTVSECFFMVFQGSRLIFLVPKYFFYSFSRFQVGFSWFQMGSFGYSRFQAGFSWRQNVFYGFSRT